MRKPEPKSRSRRAREGAVFLEALIAIGMLLIMLACVWFAHGMYATKLAKLYEARNLAWGATYTHCQNDGRGDPERAVVTAPVVAFGELSYEVGAVTQFECNEPSHPHGDLIVVFEWAFGAGGSLLDQVLDLVNHFRED